MVYPGTSRMSPQSVPSAQRTQAAFLQDKFPNVNYPRLYAAAEKLVDLKLQLRDAKLTQEHFDIIKGAILTDLQRRNDESSKA